MVLKIIYQHKTEMIGGKYMLHNHYQPRKYSQIYFKGKRQEGNKTHLAL